MHFSEKINIRTPLGLGLGDYIDYGINHEHHDVEMYYK